MTRNLTTMEALKLQGTAPPVDDLSPDLLKIVDQVRGMSLPMRDKVLNEYRDQWMYGSERDAIVAEIVRQNDEDRRRREEIQNIRNAMYLAIKKADEANADDEFDGTAELEERLLEFLNPEEARAFTNKVMAQFTGDQQRKYQREEEARQEQAKAPRPSPRLPASHPESSFANQTDGSFSTGETSAIAPTIRSTCLRRPTSRRRSQKADYTRSTSATPVCSTSTSVGRVGTRKRASGSASPN